MQYTDFPSNPMQASLLKLREATPILKTHIYLGNCSQGPQTIPVRRAIETFLDEWADRGMDWDGWIAEVEQARAAFAALIGAHPSEIAVGSSVSQLVSSLASALLTSDAFSRRRVITSTVEFPGVAQAWLAMRRYGYTVDVLAGDITDPLKEEDLLASIDDTAALVSCPHVYYADGTMFELPRIIEAAHAYGTLVFIDAYQSMGTVPLDVKALGVDFLASGTLKYLLGTAGIAFLYINPTLISHLEPTVTGWFGRVNPFAFNPKLLDYAETAARFDLGTPNIINAYAARTGMQLVMDCGVERIREHIQALSAAAYHLAPQLGLRVLGPRRVEQKGATTAIDAGSAERAHRLEAQLRQQKVVVSARNHALRLAPHGFTMTGEVEQALRAVAMLLHEDERQQEQSSTFSRNIDHR